MGYWVGVLAVGVLDRVFVRILDWTGVLGRMLGRSVG